jgi:hypothetical protein
MFFQQQGKRKLESGMLNEQCNAFILRQCVSQPLTHCFLLIASARKSLRHFAHFFDTTATRRIR